MSQPERNPGQNDGAETTNIERTSGKVEQPSNPTAPMINQLGRALTVDLLDTVKSTLNLSEKINTSWYWRADGQIGSPRPLLRSAQAALEDYRFGTQDSLQSNGFGTSAQRRFQISEPQVEEKRSVQEGRSHFEGLVTLVDRTLYDAADTLVAA